MIGYQGIPMQEAREKAGPLGERFGKLAVQQAANEISQHDQATDTLRLTGEARRWCFQLLGPSPEHPLYGRLRKGPPLYSEEEKQWLEKVNEEPKKPGRRRAKG
jgi:hypothetical protein